MLRGMFWPQSVYGVLVASQWRWLEHAAWVIFEDIFLVVACLRSMVEMRETADRTAALEQEVRTRQQAETDARNSQARNDAILDVALDCVILMDESGRIVQFNPAAERTFGYHGVGSRRPSARRSRLSRPTSASAHQDGLRAISEDRRGGGDEPAPRADRHPEKRRSVPGRSRDCAHLVRRRGDVRRLHARHHRAPPQRSRAGRIHAATSRCAHEMQRQNSEQLAALVDRASSHAAAGRGCDAGRRAIFSPA